MRFRESFLLLFGFLVIFKIVIIFNWLLPTHRVIVIFDQSWQCPSMCTAFLYPCYIITFSRYDPFQHCTYLLISWFLGLFQFTVCEELIHSKPSLDLWRLKTLLKVILIRDSIGALMNLGWIVFNKYTRGAKSAISLLSWRSSSICKRTHQCVFGIILAIWNGIDLISVFLILKTRPQLIPLLVSMRL